MTKNWLLGITVASGLILAAPVQATLIDGFGDDQDTVTANEGDAQDSNTLKSVTDTALSQPVSRTLTVEFAEGNNNVEMGVADDLLSFSSDSLTKGTGTVEWSFEAMDFSSPLRLELFVRENDKDDTPFRFSLIGAEQFDFESTLDHVSGDQPGVTQTFNMFSGDELTGITGAEFFIDGSETSALDLSVGSIKAVPAPGALGLLGIGLLGLGLATRLGKRS